MIALIPPDEVLIADVRRVLAARWMPLDWFKLDDRVAMHYAWKAAIALAAAKSYGRQICPMLEIGSRAGYSMLAFATGADHIGVVFSAVCIDGGLDDDSHKTIPWFRATMKTQAIDARLIVANSHSIYRLPDGAKFAHVDGDHSDAGCFSDLALVADCPVILADDCDNPSVELAVTRFCEAHGRQVRFVEDGLRRLGIIEKVDA